MFLKINGFVGFLSFGLSRYIFSDTGLKGFLNIYWIICDTPIEMLIFHSKVWVLIGGLHGSNMSHGLDRLCPTMLPEAKWIGEKSADGRTYYRSRKSYSGKTLCAENGLGIPQFQTALGGLVLDIFEVNWGFLAAMMFFFSRKSVRVLKEWVSLTVKIWYMNILDILDINWLVVWNMNFIFPIYIYIDIGNVIIPTDELIFFRGVGIPWYTTNQFWPRVFHDIRHNLSSASAMGFATFKSGIAKKCGYQKVAVANPNHSHYSYCRLTYMLWL